MSLPKKDLYTLDEIIVLWKFAGCDYRTLLDYARRDLLVYSVYLRDLGPHEHVQEIPGGRRVTRTESPVVSFTSPTYVPMRIGYLASEDARRVLECNEGESAAVHSLFPSPERESGTSTGYMTAKLFKPADLFVSARERKRFEKAHPLGAAGRIARWWSWLRDAENRNALLLIGSWITTGAVAAWAVFTFLYHSAGAGSVK